jgi:acyl dehydratase
MGFVTAEHRALLGKPGIRQTAANPVSRESLRRLTQGAMELDPMLWDDEIAAGTRYGRVVAAPLFPLHAFTRAAGTPDPLDKLAADPDWDGSDGGGIRGLAPLDLPLRRILNGGTRARFFRLARIGDAISTQSRYVQIEDREGRSGPMVVVSIETDYRNQDDELLMRVRSTFIWR